MGKNMVSDNFAPNWLPYLTPEGEIIPDVSFLVDCQICRKNLAITHPATGDDFEMFCVLPCGHAFGYECLKLWLEASDYATCPSCRFSLWHRRCNHYITAEPLYLGVENMHRSISESIAGHEGLPPNCESCQSESESESESESSSEDDGDDTDEDDNDGDDFTETARAFFEHQRQMHPGMSSQFGASNFHFNLSGGIIVHQGPPPHLQAMYFPPHPAQIQRRDAIVSGMAAAPRPTGIQRRRRERREGFHLPPSERDAAMEELMTRVAGQHGRIE
ncbi:hypothetical protein F4678DRAFT_478290 [Xylaria arbuscula]|nr:hypothetical protein F4678DRAFT_478290 [Xylaria arbuscula]